MPIAKKPANTIWRAKNQLWQIYINPLDPDQGILEILVSPEMSDPKFDVIEYLKQQIKSNSTYQKFSQRDSDNTCAILKGQTQTIAREGGYSTTKALLGSAALSAIPGIMNIFKSSATTSVSSFFTVFNSTCHPSSVANINLADCFNQAWNFLSQSNTKEMAKSDVAATFADIQVAVSVIIPVVLIAGGLINHYFIDREKKQKQLYDVQKKLFERLPKIAEEIQQKERVIEKLEIFLKHNALQVDLKEQWSVIERLDISEKNEEIVIELGNQNSPVQLVLRDLLINVLDETNDLIVYENIEKILDEFDGFLEKDKNIVAIALLNFLKVMLASKHLSLPE